MRKSKKRAGNGSARGVATLPQSVGDTAAAHADRDRIAARAYELYLARGGVHGLDMDDWLLAERELKGGSNGPNAGH